MLRRPSRIVRLAVIAMCVYQAGGCISSSSFAGYLQFQFASLVAQGVGLWLQFILQSLNPFGSGGA